MKIGLFTMPLFTNYGCILQAYALQTALERMGHEVEVITKPFYFPSPSQDKVVIYLRRIFWKYILFKPSYIFLERHENKVYPVISQNTQRFIDAHIHTVFYDDICQDNVRHWDALVVGSDQIWRPKYFTNVEEAYFEFAKNWKIKRVSYAPSFGSSNWEYTDEQTRRCSELAHLFDAISVREDSGVDLCKQYLGVDAVHVLDPTMLLAVEDYKAFISSDVPSSNGALVTYVLEGTPAIDNVISTLSTRLNLKVLKANSRCEDPLAPLEERIQPPVEQWLNYFKDASFIVADSFHACVFSILFHKPFLVMANASRGNARMESLLRMFDLTSRMIYREDQLEECLQSTIDYQRVDAKLNELRMKSMDFLMNALNC